jgi:hypothetical protein
MRSASLSLFDCEKSRDNAEKTFVCFGTPRGGTSMVAGLMSALGVKMGDGLSDNYEDPDFVARPKAKILGSIDERNERYSTWGWKYPQAANYLNGICDKLRNPRLVIVYRDPVAIGTAHMRWHGREFSHALHDVTMQQMKNNILAERLRIPVLFVSYEKAILNRTMFIDELALFLCVNKPEEYSDLVTFMEPQSYKLFNEMKGKADE